MSSTSDDKGCEAPHKTFPPFHTRDQGHDLFHLYQATNQPHAHKQTRPQRGVLTNGCNEHLCGHQLRKLFRDVEQHFRKNRSNKQRPSGIVKLGLGRGCGAEVGLGLLGLRLCGLCVAVSVKLGVRWHLCLLRFAGVRELLPLFFCFICLLFHDGVAQPRGQLFLSGARSFCGGKPRPGDAVTRQGQCGERAARAPTQHATS